jgi:FkbM family methyltransferase
MTDIVKSIMAYQRSRGGAHHAGTLTTGPLEHIVWYFENYFKGTPVISVETGCGASTILFSQYSSSHAAYCYDDRRSANSSVNFALEFRGFNKRRVKWVFGPTQTTVFSKPLRRDVDLILIDGPHGYPFPELEYFAFYQRLKPGGILIIDDIHIPTVNNLYKFLLQDDSFYAHGVTATTAFFQRSERPPFDMQGDGWNFQRYNVQGFPAVNHEDAGAGSSLPVSFVFEGKLARPQPPLTRGFSVQNGRPVTEGSISLIELKVAARSPKIVKITLDIEPICVGERLRHDPGFKLAIDGKQVAAFDFQDSTRRTIEVKAETNSGEILRLEFWHSGVVSANELHDWQKQSAWVWYDGRLLNFWLHSISIADGTDASAPNVLTRVDGSVIGFHHAGERFEFFIDEADDSIQSFHLAGRFYEQDALEAIRHAVPDNAEILDVGAHVGNHCVFFANLLNAKKIVAVEPNPRVQSALRLNVVLNRLNNIDLTRAHYALGANPGTGRMVTVEKYNSGATIVDATHGGPVNIVRGDELFADEHFSFVKIDVEGMELEVIDGLAQLIRRAKPILFVDAKIVHSEAVAKRMTNFGYRIEWQSEAHADHVHYLCKPITCRS